MINYIWSGLLLVSLVTAAFNGRIGEVAEAALEGAKGAITLSLTLLGVIMLWTGLMRIASKSGLVDFFAKALRPLMRVIFPKLPPNSAAAQAIVMNMVANAFGMANAATPLGLNAMKELSKLNRDGSIASDEMCMLVVINTASIQILPATIIAIRQAAGSAAPFSPVVPVWLASLSAVTVGVIAAKTFARGGKRQWK